MFSSKPTAQKLADKSRAIVDVFTSTIDSLAEVNVDAASYQAQKEAELKIIEQEIAGAAEIQASNGRVIEKVKKILE